MPLLKVVIHNVIEQVDMLWVSDNTPVDLPEIAELLLSVGNNVVYKKMKGNAGIAKAQNEGIKYAISKNFDFVLFLDQDSLVPQDMVIKLHNQFCFLESQGYRVGGIGPQPYNREKGKPYSANIKKGFFVNDCLRKESEIISSASLYRIRLFEEVGLMEEVLFIDYVDFEFCWRASYYGKYLFFVDSSLYLSHKLGEGDKMFLGISVKIPTPFRIYYRFRNYFILMRRRYVPLYWKVANGIKNIAKYVYFPLFCKPRRYYFERINKGICDGISFRKKNEYENSWYSCSL